MKANKTWKIGMGIYLGMFVFCLLFSFLLPMDPYQQNMTLKNLSPARNYLSLPKEVEPKEVKKIVSGASFGCALMKSGDVITWGDDGFMSEPINNVLDIAAGDHHLVVLYNDHSINLFTNESVTLSEIENNQMITHVFASGNATAMLYANGHVQYSDGTVDNERWDQDQGHVLDVAMNDHQIALVLDDGRVHMFGEDENEIATVPETLCPVRDMVLSENDALALCQDQRVVTWGESGRDVFSVSDKVKMIDASKEALFVLDENNRIRAYGKNTFHETEVPNEPFETIYADAYQIYGIHEDIHAWGHRGFLMGSDAYGRDVFTRLVHGGLVTMSIGWIAVITEMILAVLFGCLAGYYGGKVDGLLMRLAELISGVPFLPLMVTLSAFMKELLPESGRILLVMIVYGCLNAPVLARMIRSVLLSEKEKEYVIAAKLMGANTWHILKKELFPAILPILLVNLTLSYADSMLLESALSFIGFGVAQPYPSWGNLLENAQSAYVLEHCWWQWVLPALCIVICVFGVHVIQEGLRKMCDPKEGRS